MNHSDRLIYNFRIKNSLEIKHYREVRKLNRSEFCRILRSFKSVMYLYIYLFYETNAQCISFTQCNT